MRGFFEIPVAPYNTNLPKNTNSSESHKMSNARDTAIEEIEGTTAFDTCVPAVYGEMKEPNKMAVMIHITQVQRMTT